MNSDINSLFVDRNETPIWSLKNGNVQNLLSGESFKNETAIVTNKRLYYSHKTGLINKVSEDDIIDIKDITGTKIVDRNPISIIILAVLFGFIALANFVTVMSRSFYRNYSAAFILFMVAIILLIIYFFCHKKHLYIEYAGGSIQFSLIGYSKQNISNFQKSIYSVKDSISNQNIQ